MATRTIKLTVAALGGQGGGVLTDWLIAIAEAGEGLFTDDAGRIAEVCRGVREQSVTKRTPFWPPLIMLALLLWLECELWESELLDM